MESNLDIYSTKIELESAERRDLFKLALSLRIPFILLYNQDKNIIINLIREQQDYMLAVKKEIENKV